MTASRTQHTISATLVLAVAAVVTWTSFTQEPADAFLFPRLISIFFIVLAAWNFARASLGLACVGEGVPMKTVLNFLPGLIIALAFFAIYTIYDPAPLSSAAGWGKRIVTTALFMAVIYGLFALLLKVQAPRGLYF